jgi:hypothetical protein
MAYDWTMFFDQYAGDFHETFQKELSRQLFEKGAMRTGIQDFKDHNLQLIVGMRDTNLRQVANQMIASIDFITPTSFSFLVDIYWCSDTEDNISEIHRQGVSKTNISIDWADNFPIDKILPHLVDAERLD